MSESEDFKRDRPSPGLRAPASLITQPQITGTQESAIIHRDLISRLFREIGQNTQGRRQPAKVIRQLTVLYDRLVHELPQNQVGKIAGGVSKVRAQHLESDALTMIWDSFGRDHLRSLGVGDDRLWLAQSAGGTPTLQMRGALAEFLSHDLPALADGLTEAIAIIKYETESGKAGPALYRDLPDDRQRALCEAVAKELEAHKPAIAVTRVDLQGRVVHDPLTFRRE